MRSPSPMSRAAGCRRLSLYYEGSLSLDLSTLESASQMRAGGSNAIGEMSGEPTSGSSDFDNLIASAAVRTLSTGGILFREGDPKTHLHRIAAGIICVYRKRIDRPHEVIEFVFPGDALGLGYLDHHIYRAKALVETRVQYLPLIALDDLLQYDYRAKKRAVETLQREFAHRRHLLINAARRKPVGRLAAFFLSVSHLNKNEGRDPSMIIDSLKCGVVADWLGLDLDTLGDALVELEKKGLIEQSASLGLRLKNLSALKDLADENVMAFSATRSGSIQNSAAPMEA